MDTSKPILVTGAAGFIGSALTRKLLAQGHNVVGVDNLNDYYDPALKKARLSSIEKLNNDLVESKDKAQTVQSPWSFHKVDLENNSEISHLFEEIKPSAVVNLAAQAGVRYSIENPSAYIQSNLVGFGNILEGCRKSAVKHLVYASSSSVYGGNSKLPFSESDSVGHPVSLYAATKRANELMAHTYSHLYSLPTTGLRFFTVYGPWGRPDMALFLFTKAILNGENISIFNKGKMVRDFTYIDDIVESLSRLIFKPATPQIDFDTSLPNAANSWAPYKLFNIGNSKPTQLMEYIEAIESSLGIKAKKNLLPMQSGDVQATAADTSALEEWIGFKPNTSIQEGVSNFVKWYRDFYEI